MIDFELSLEEGNPVKLFSFAVDLQTAPPKISGKTLNVEKYIPLNSLVKNVPFRDAVLQEGFLNIYSCFYENGKCTVYFFGDLKSTQLRSQVDFKVENLRDFDQLNEKIQFILSKSKSILKSYYKSDKIKNIEHHILAFLSDKMPG